MRKPHLQVDELRDGLCKNMKTHVVNIRTHTHTPQDVLIDRRTPFGNPFRMSQESDRPGVIRKFRAYAIQRMKADPAFRRAVLALKGKILVCHCKPKACHGDVYLELLSECDSGGTLV